jgi:hypothetical protein
VLQVSLQDIPSMRDFLADVVDLRDVSKAADKVATMAAASAVVLYDRGGAACLFMTGGGCLMRDIHDVELELLCGVPDG